MKNTPFNHAAKRMLIAASLVAALIDSRAAGVTLSWDAPSLGSASVSFYRIFYGDVSGAYNQHVDVANDTAVNLTDLEFNKAYFFAVKAFSNDSESDLSSEVTWSSPFIAVEDTHNVTLAWNASTPTSEGISFYRLFYGTESGSYDQSVDISSGTAATLTDLEYNQDYFIAVKAYTPNSESAFSDELTWTSPSMADTDSDNISDHWEVRFAGSLSSMQESSDQDQDGVLDREEFIAGTNPLNADEFPAVSIETTPEGTTVSFKTQSAVDGGYENRTRYYTLMQCDDLSSGNWTAVPGVENIPAFSGNALHDVPQNSSGRFYKTEIILD